MFFSTRSTSCSIHMLAFALIPFMEYDVVFPSTFVNSFTLVFKTGDSSFAAHCFAFCLDCSFRSRVCSSDSLTLSACVKKNFSSSATSEVEVVIPIGVVWISSLIWRRILSVTLSSSLEKKAVLLNQRNVCYFEVKFQHIITCIPECWRNCLYLEKAGDGLVVCQDNCWLCCFPQNVCKFEKCHIDYEKFF